MVLHILVADRAQELKDALFLVGEIGGNDFNFAFFQGKTIEEEKSIVPDVVQIISDAVRVIKPLIKLDIFNTLCAYIDVELIDPNLLICKNTCRESFSMAPNEWLSLGTSQ